MENSKMEVKIGEIFFSGEGDQAWLTEQFDKLLSKSEKLLGLAKINPSKMGAPSVGQPVDTGTDGGTDILDADIYTYDEKSKELAIHKTPQDNTLAKQMVSLAILYLYGKGIVDPVGEVTFDEIRKICEDHKCLDKSNFSSVLRKEKKPFVISGAGKFSKIKLSVPGKAIARELVSALKMESEAK